MMLKILEITAPLIFALSFGETVDLGNTEIRAVAPMDCAVIVTAKDGQALEAQVSIGVIDGAGLARQGLCVDRVSNSSFDVRSIRGVTENGLIVQQSGQFGTFNNFWRINAIIHNGGNGVLIVSPTGGVLGVQGNHFQIGQIFSNGHSGIAVFGRESAWNYFQVGPVEVNALWGIYDAGRENTWLVPNTNNNGIKGFINLGQPPSLAVGVFSDGRE